MWFLTATQVKKDTTTKAGKKDLKEKAKIRRPVKLMT